MPALNPVDYRELNSRQQENYNFAKVSALLADYGYVTIRLSDDWQGADFIAMHIHGSFLKIQLKGRLVSDRKYLGKDIWICFHDQKNHTWYLYPHDELHTWALPKIERTWEIAGSYTWPSVPAAYADWLKARGYQLKEVQRAPAALETKD